MKVKVSQTKQTVVSTVGIQGPPGPNNGISKLEDVDVRMLADGSLLIYDVETSKWVASTQLEKQLMNGGFF